ncbi:MAG: helix-turn-helix transcriptional regulator, partial [Pirellulaceae bacterium]|nr:helix-turn-helix transcriptional regulator [Pirellulaceae bacterium]
RAGQGPRGGTSALKLNGSAGERYFAAMRVLQSKSRHLQLHDAIYNTGPLVLVSLHEADQPIQLPVDLLWRSFALTDAEAKLAEALVNGWTLAELAQDRQVSKQTLRNQLVGLMRKTGTKRQSQLVSLLTRLSLGAI